MLERLARLGFNTAVPSSPKEGDIVLMNWVFVRLDRGSGAAHFPQISWRPKFSDEFFFELDPEQIYTKFLRKPVDSPRLQVHNCPTGRRFAVVAAPS